MKIRYSQGLGFPYREVELSTHLEPTNTGSTQGTVEQLEAELEVCKKAIGNLLAWMVETSVLELEKAEDICGIHKAFREYRFPDRVIVK